MRGSAHVALALVLLAGAALARPDFRHVLGAGATRPDPEGRPRTYEFSSPAIKDGRAPAAGDGPVLSYTATVAEGLVSLNDDLTVEAVHCNADSLELEVTSQESVASWVAGKTIVAGGLPWGCGEPILRRVLGVEWVSGTQALVRTAKMATEEALEHASIRMQDPKRVPRAHVPHAEQATAVAVAAATARAARSVAAVQDNEVTIETPVAHQPFGEGSTINVQFATQNVPAGHHFKVYAYVEVPHRTDPLLAESDKIYQKDGVKEYTASFTVGKNWPMSQNTYIQIDWCHVFCNEAARVYFTSLVGVNAAVMLPTTSAMYSEGDQIPLQWVALPGALGANKVATYHIKNIETNQTYYSTYGQAAVEGTNDFSMIAGDWPNSQNYYWSVWFDCTDKGLSCKQEIKSSLFTIGAIVGKDGIQLTYPTRATEVRVGTPNFKIKWIPNNVTAPVTVKLYHSAWGVDPHWDIALDIPAVRGEVITPEGLVAKLPPSTDYYAVVEHSCRKVLFWNYCSQAFSPRFPINAPHIFTFTGPKVDTIYHAKNSVTATWSTARKGKVWVDLMQDIPGWIDLPLDLHSNAQVDAAAGSWTYAPKNGTVFPVYFAISYDCAFLNRFWCTTERSPLFHILQDFSVAWNKDPETGSIINPHIDIGSTSCAKYCPTAAPGDVICEMCALGWDFSIDLYCQNCWAQNDLALYNMKLEIQNFQLLEVAASVEDSLHMFAQLRVDGTMHYAKSGTIPVFEYPISFTPIDVLGVTIAPKLTVSVIFKYNFLFDSYQTASIIVENAAVYDVVFSYTSQTGVNVDDKFQVTINKVTLEGSAIGQANLVLSLGPKLAFEVLGFKASADLTPSVNPLLNGQYPAYPAGPQPLDPSLLPFGNCSTPHYFEFRTTSKLDFDAAASFMQYSKSWHKQIGGPWNISSACFLQPLTPHQTAQMVPWKFGLTPSVQTISKPALRDLIRAAVVESLALPSSSLNIESFVMDKTSLQVGLVVMPFDETSDTMEIAKRIQAELGDCHSRFYSTVVGKKLQPACLGEVPIVIDDVEGLAAGMHVSLLAVALAAVFAMLM